MSAAEAVEQDVPEPVQGDAEAVADAKEAAEEAAASEMVVRDPGHVGTRRRGEWDAGQINLIKATVAKGASDGQLGMFLELCARYQLDPFAKQIWCANMGGGFTIMVSRDGLLALADRHNDFEGMDGDIVRSEDTFVKEHGPEGVAIKHVVEDGDIEKRGEIVGAWAVVFRRGRRPTYFFAPFKQYKRGDNTPWGKQTDAMILKVAESMALRKAFTVSGVVGEDEMTPQLQTVTRPGEVVTHEVEWPQDEDLASELKTGFKLLGYTKAKMRLKVNGKTEEELRAVLAELQSEADTEDEVIQDAEVVDG